MVDVQILGAGWAGLAIARHLRDAGVHARVVDPRGALGGAAGRALGIALPCVAEHPHRLEAALGASRAGELVAWIIEGLRTLPGFRPVGVRWIAEAPEIEPAAERIGLATIREPDGLTLLDGGEVDLAELGRTLSAEVHAEAVDAEITVHATAWEPATSFLADKLMPVRWQAASFDGPALATPVVSQHATVAWTGGLVAFGARWATPHMEVGETDPTPSPQVEAMLERLTRATFAVGSRQRSWAGIVAESCDGLPIVGAIPGRPRELVSAGFGAFGLPMAWCAARAVADAIVGRTPGIPSTLHTSRFR